MKRMFAAGLLALPSLLLAGTVASAQSCATGNCGSGGAPAAYNPGPGFGTPRHLGCPGGFCFRLFGAGFGQEGPMFNYGPYAGYYPFAPYGPWGSDMSYSGPGSGGGCNGPGCGWNLPFGRHGRDGCGAGGCGAGGSGLGRLFGGHGSGGGCGPGGCGSGGGLGGIGQGRLFGGGAGGHGLGGGCSGGGCGAVANGSDGWGGYAMNTLRGVFSRSHPCSNKAKISTGCCAAPASGCGDCAGSSAVAPAALHPVSAESAAPDDSGVRGFRER